MSEKNNEDLSLQSLIKEGDDLIDGIINKKTVKSHYVREEDEGKLVALQFPVQDRAYIFLTLILSRAVSCFISKNFKRLMFI